MWSCDDKAREILGRRKGSTWWTTAKRLSEVVRRVVWAACGKQRPADICMQAELCKLLSYNDIFWEMVKFQIYKY